MKSILLTKRISPVLFTACLLLMASHYAFAAKPVRTPPVVINSVSIDFSINKILITGSGFSNTATVTIGGVDIPSGEISVIDDSNLEIPFSSTTALAVQREGNYALLLNDQAFSLYINSAIPDPGVAAVCPCVRLRRHDLR